MPVNARDQAILQTAMLLFSQRTAIGSIAGYTMRDSNTTPGAVKLAFTLAEEFVAGAELIMPGVFDDA